jgi:acetolactate synthase-1/3 small subunit
MCGFRPRLATGIGAVYALQKDPRYAQNPVAARIVAVMRHIIAVLLQNEAGALSRVASLFSTRGYNIESLSVAPTDDPTVSRLTLVTTGSDAVMSQIISQLGKLVDVVRVDDLTRGEHFERELLLLKLHVTESQLGPLTELVNGAAGRILSGALQSFVVELTSSEAQVTRFLGLAAQRGDVLEVVRSGALGIKHGGATVAQIAAT